MSNSSLCAIVDCTLAPTSLRFTCDNHSGRRLRSLDDDEPFGFGFGLPELKREAVDELFDLYVKGLGTLPQAERDEVALLLVYLCGVQSGLTKSHYAALLTRGELELRRGAWVPGAVLLAAVQDARGTDASVANFEAALELADECEDMTPELLRALARHPDVRARKAAAQHPLPEDLRGLLTADADPEVALLALGYRVWLIPSRRTLEMHLPLAEGDRVRIRELLPSCYDYVWRSVPLHDLPSLDRSVHDDPLRQAEVVAHLTYEIDDPMQLETALTLFQGGWHDTIERLVETARTV